jgi:hypothetical protein
MAVEENGPSAQDAAPPGGDPGPATGQPAADASAADTPSDGKPSAGADPGAGKRPIEAEGGPERRRGRRARDGDSLGGLFAGIKDSQLRHVYVKPDDDYERACRALTSRRVVLLQGEPGSGRHAMARHLLLHGLRLHGIKLEQIATIPHTTKLGALKPTQKRSGHLLERLPAKRARRLRADELGFAEEILVPWEGYLVITIDHDVTVLEGEDSEQLVTCARQPDLKRVLKRHLKFLLRGHGGLLEEDRAWLEGDAIRVHLTRHPGLKETVRLARDLAEEMANDQAPGRSERLNRRLDFQETPAPPETPEQRARRQLERSPDVEHWSHVIALAVFAGGRSQLVADAAGRLAKRLAPADPRSDTAWQPGPVRPARPRTDGPGEPLRRMALIVPGHVPAWRPGQARSDWLELAGGERYEALEQVILYDRSPTLRVRFKDPSLRTAVLDYVWNELDELRGPVRDWLDELGDDLDPEMVEQTATAVAYLASHGLGYVLELIIGPWMQRGRPSRLAAAYALGLLGREDTRFTGSVLMQLSSWARWGNDIERETAALAYGLALGEERPDVALRELRALAMREAPERRRLVARAMYELFRRSRHAEVLEALCAWTARPERATWSPAEQRLLHTGLLAFLLVTGVYDETPLRPSLVSLAEESPELRGRIVDLWRRALADDTFGEDAGRMLCEWAREADVQAAAAGGQEPELVEALHRLAADVAAGGSGHGGRVRLALTRCATAYDGPSAVARTLVKRFAEEERHGRRHPV